MRWVRIILTVLFAPPIFGLAALCAGAATAAQWGRVGAKWDLLAQFAPFWFAGALAALLAGLAFHGLIRTTIVGTACIGLLAAGALIAPEFVRSTGPRAAPHAPGQIKLIQFNTWGDNSDPRGAVDWLIAQKPDIVVLEETSMAMRQLIAQRTDWREVRADGNLAILGRPEIMAPDETGGVGQAGPVVQARFHTAAGAFRVLGVHYPWPTNPEQAAQARYLSGVLAELPKDTTILAGDFNSTPWSFARRREDRAFGLIRRDRALFSWPAVRFGPKRYPAPFPVLPIDHVYAGRGWATVKVARGPWLGSDHYPVVVNLAPVARP